MQWLRGEREMGGVRGNTLGKRSQLGIEEGGEGVDVEIRHLALHLGFTRKITGFHISSHAPLNRRAVESHTLF